MLLVLGGGCPPHRLQRRGELACFERFLGEGLHHRVAAAEERAHRLASAGGGLNTLGQLQRAAVGPLRDRPLQRVSLGALDLSHRLAHRDHRQQVPVLAHVEDLLGLAVVAGAKEAGAQAQLLSLVGHVEHGHRTVFLEQPGGRLGIDQDRDGGRRLGHPVGELCAASNGRQGLAAADLHELEG